MAHVRKDTLTAPVEWWLHLRRRKRDQAKRERQAAKRQIRARKPPLTMKTTPLAGTWRPMPNPIKEAEIELQISWVANERTTEAILRQSELMGYQSATAYLQQLIASTVSDSERDTWVNDSGELVNGCDIDRPSLD